MDSTRSWAFRTKDNGDTWIDRTQEQDGYASWKGALLLQGCVALFCIVAPHHLPSHPVTSMVWLQSLQKFLTFSSGLPKGDTWLWNILFFFTCALLHLQYLMWMTKAAMMTSVAHILNQSFPCIVYHSSNKKSASVVTCMYTFTFPPPRFCFPTYDCPHMTALIYVTLSMQFSVVPSFSAMYPGQTLTAQVP